MCDVESMDFNTTFDVRKCDHTTRIPLSCKTPLERTLGELPCLCSAQNPNMLVNLSVSRAVQAICAELSTSANNDGDGDGREKARTADGGTFARLCVRGRRKVCRAQLENRRSKTKRHNVPDSRRALHMHVLERDFTCIRAACMQHDCATIMCKYAERCGDRRPVTIPGHEFRVEKRIGKLPGKFCCHATTNNRVKGANTHRPHTVDFCMANLLGVKCWYRIRLKQECFVT